MSDRVAILRDGKLLQLGAPERALRAAGDALRRGVPRPQQLPRRQGRADLGRRLRLSLRQLAVRAARPRAQAGNRRRGAGGAAARAHPAGRAGSQLVNILDGTIAEFSYLGTTFHLLVDTVVGRLAVTVPTWRHGAAPVIGSRITLSWDPDASIRVEQD